MKMDAMIFYDITNICIVIYSYKGFMRNIES